MIFVMCADEQWRSLSRSHRGYGLAGDKSAFPGGLAGDVECGDDAFRSVDHGRDRGGRGVRGCRRRSPCGGRSPWKPPPATDSSASIRRTVPGDLFAYRPCLDLTIG